MNDVLIGYSLVVIIFGIFGAVYSALGQPRLSTKLVIMFAEMAMLVLYFIMIIMEYY